MMRDEEAEADDPGDVAEVIALVPSGGDSGDRPPNVGPPSRLFDDSMIGAPADPIEGPAGAAPATAHPVAVPRLARHEIVLDDDHKGGVAVCGRGLPLVLVHGFTAEGILYA